MATRQIGATNSSHYSQVHCSLCGKMVRATKLMTGGFKLGVHAKARDKYITCNGSGKLLNDSTVAKDCGAPMGSLVCANKTKHPSGRCPWHR